MHHPSANIILAYLHHHVKHFFKLFERFKWEKNHIVGTCDCCDTTVPTSELYWVGDEAVCFNCYNNETFTCEHCGERFYNSEKMWVEEKEAFFCSDCYYQNKGEE